MPASNHTRETPERLVAIQLLEQPSGRDRTAVYRALAHVERSEIDEAITNLEEAGVLMDGGSLIWASPALVCLERLELVAI